MRDSSCEIWASGAIARPARIEQAIRPPMVSSLLGDHVDADDDDAGIGDGAGRGGEGDADRGDQALAQRAVRMLLDRLAASAATSSGAAPAVLTVSSPPIASTSTDCLSRPSPIARADSRSSAGWVSQPTRMTSGTISAGHEHHRAADDPDDRAG